MFRCPACHHTTLTLLQRVAASDPDYPALCPRCGCRSVTDQSLLGTFAWVEAPAMALAGVLWLLTGSGLLAARIAVASAALVLPLSLFRVPLRPVPAPQAYPAELGVGTSARPVVGPLAYGVLLLLAFAAVLAGAGALLFVVP